MVKGGGRLPLAPAPKGLPRTPSPRGEPLKPPYGHSELHYWICFFLLFLANRVFCSCSLDEISTISQYVRTRRTLTQPCRFLRYGSVYRGYSDVARYIALWPPLAVPFAFLQKVLGRGSLAFITYRQSRASSR